MRNNKRPSPKQPQAAPVKDFFDMILPGMVKFLPDHYLVGDSGRYLMEHGGERYDSGERGARDVEYGYVRVSSRDQNDGRQVLALAEAGVGAKDVYGYK